MKALEVNKVDCLPHPLSRMKPANEAGPVHPVAPARRSLSVIVRSRQILVPIEDVVYLKAELKYITIRTLQREYLLEESLTKLEREFGARFVRIHRNCLVARSHIRAIETRVSEGGCANWEVVLDVVPETLPMSRRLRHVVRESSAHRPSVTSPSLPFASRIGRKASAASDNQPSPALDA